MAHPIYFGSVTSRFDIFELKYRCFGVVWMSVSGTYTIAGFWFADTVEEVRVKADAAGWKGVISCSDTGIIDYLYWRIRYDHKHRLWYRQLRLPLSSTFRYPWNRISPGWYVTHSRHKFPCHIHLIQRRRWTVWIVHTYLCESKSDSNVLIAALRNLPSFQINDLIFADDVQPFDLDDP